ncbi:sensor histidine kinase [Vulgatibacter sp.]|uniref:sensor histidine kinase n=1 Tax=Vulgatibacter sp. TaxID=1971226 RepID=UPI003567F56F
MRLSIATRIFLGFAAVLCVFGAVSSFAVWRMHAIGEEIRLVSEGYLPLTKVAAQLETFHKNKQRDTDRLLEEKDPRTQRILIKLARLYFPRIVREKLGQGQLLVTETRRLAGDGEQLFLDQIEKQLTELGAEYDRYDANADALFAGLEQADGAADPALEERGRELKRIERRIDRSLKLLSHALEGRIQERVREAQAQERSSSWAIVGFSIGAIVLGIAATILSQRLLAPIRPLTEAAVRIGRGDYSAEVPTSVANEVGVLAREFNQMAASLRARERELQEKQEALVRAEKLATVGRMAAQITHEIRNPLSSIGLNTELLAEEIGSQDEAEARRLCSAIAREVDRLTEITEEYLHFARLPKPQRAAENVGELVRDLVAFVKPELEAAGIGVELDLPGDLEASLDENQIRQALLNLVRNAREAMPGGGTLRFAAQPAGGGVELRVSDTGMGMRAEDVARIFDPFYTTKERGTGLGLSLTQQIVAQHGGTLRCESALQQGTTFTLHFPGASV